jgi:hypothetical protein
MSTDEETHQKWVKWLSEMDRYVKNNVCLYEMKAIREKHLKNPRAHLNQEGLGKLDLLTTYVYNYDGGVIGAGGQYEVIENIPYGDGVEIGDTLFSDVDEKILEQKEKEMLDRIDNIISEKGEIRIGMYSKQGYSVPSFYLISTNHNEDPSYYTKCDKHLYDNRSVELYYMIRYGISSDTYYILSGMSAWEEIADIPITTPSPVEYDKIDQTRFIHEHLEGVDLDAIYDEIEKMSNRDFETVMKFCNKHNLSRLEFDYISNRG